MGLFSSIGGIVGSIFGGPVGGAIGGALGGLGDTAISSNAAKNAAKDQASAAQAAGNNEMAMYYQTRADQMPWLEQGQKSLGLLSDLTGTSGNKDTAGYGSLIKPFSMQDYQEDPGYQFRLAEGQKALDRAMSARGSVFSGAAAKALNRYNQDYASGEYDKAYNRYRDYQTDVYNRLAGIARTGQTTASDLGVRGAGAVANQNSYLTSAAASNAAGGVAANNAWSTGLNGIGNDIAGLGANQGWWGGYDPNSGVTWNTGRY